MIPSRTIRLLRRQRSHKYLVLLLTCVSFLCLILLLYSRVSLILQICVLLCLKVFIISVPAQTSEQGSYVFVNLVTYLTLFYYSYPCPNLRCVLTLLICTVISLMFNFTPCSVFVSPQWDSRVVVTYTKRMLIYPIFVYDTNCLLLSLFSGWPPTPPFPLWSVLYLLIYEN